VRVIRPIAVPVDDQQQPGGRRPEEGTDMVSTPRSGSGSGRRLSSIRPVQVLAGAVGVIAIVFIVQNRHRVHIDFFAFNLSAPVWLVLTVMVLVGVLIGYLLGRRRSTAAKTARRASSAEPGSGVSG
jgi:lipopolysaccharide assembly protein A